MIYEETGCSDPWKVRLDENNDAEVAAAIRTYFDENYSLSFAEIEIKRETLEVTCYACHCPTGNKYIVKVEEAFVNTLKGEGFYLK